MCFTMEDAKHAVETLDALLTGMCASGLKEEYSSLFISQ